MSEEHLSAAQIGLSGILLPILLELESSERGHEAARMWSRLLPDLPLKKMGANGEIAGSNRRYHAKSRRRGLSFQMESTFPDLNAVCLDFNSSFQQTEMSTVSEASRKEASDRSDDAREGQRGATKKRRIRDSAPIARLYSYTIA